MFRVRIWLLIFTLPLLVYGQPRLFEPALSPRIANYNIAVTLLPSPRMLNAKEMMIWHNRTPLTVNEMQLHLYLNAFRNNRSTFMQEAGDRRSESKVANDGWGSIDIHRLVLSDSTDLTAALQFIHPDDDNGEDKTVVRIPLPKPAAPGDSVVLVIDFTAKLPQPPIARTGAKEEYFFIGQWFPKVGVLENNGWNCHQFHHHSEFYADYGVYDVRMTVPQKNLVAATGVCVSLVHNGDSTATHYYHAEDVHDFAWTTSPDFAEFKDKSQDVEIRVLMQKDHVAQGRRYLAAAKIAVAEYQDRYGDYPYPNLTVVDPRRGATATGGMEYPTLITAGTAYGLPEGLRIPELIIIHEFGHNFWYHLVANNEFEEAWLDEGINTYSEMQILKDRYGPDGDVLNLACFRLQDMQLLRFEYASAPQTDHIVQPAWSYYSGASYGVNSYAKPGLALSTLHNYLGPERMSCMLRTFFARWKFKHPHTKDFIAVANETAGENLDWFFDQVLYTSKTLDYGIDKLICKEIPDSSGYDYTLSCATTPDSAKTKQDSSAHQKEKQKKPYLTIVDVRRFGDFIFPVELEFQFENGEKIRETWTAAANGKSIVLSNRTNYGSRLWIRITKFCWIAT